MEKRVCDHHIGSMTPLAKAVIFLIDRYQNQGGGERIFYVDCNFTPSCSEYTKLCIQRFGLFIGLYLGIKRILRCNDRELLHKNYDPPPPNWKSVIMLEQAKVDAEEERLRKEIIQLPDEYRKEYYSLSKKQIKDPDTYAVLNYSFFLGLHHFYLGHWARAMVDYLGLLIGVALLFFGEITLILGILIIGIIIINDWYELFRSQIIVQHHNNQIMAKILVDVKKKVYT